MGKEDDETLDFILNEVLPTLSQSHLKKLSGHIAVLVRKTRSERSLSPEELEFYDILTSRMRRFVLGNFNIGTREGKSSIPKVRGFDKKSFSEGFKNLIEFWKPLNLSRADRVRMYVLYSDSLISYVKVMYPEEQGIKKTVECLGRVSEVLELNFPGYFPGGLHNAKSRATAKLWLNR